MSNGLIKRYGGNPILTKDDVPYDVASVHNAGVVKFDGKYIMLFRSHRLNGRSVIGIAESSNGFDFKVADKPFMEPDPAHEYEEYGVEDPRITRIEDEFFITYSAYSGYGVRIGLAKTRDFKTIERIAFITEVDYRNVVIFPEKINGLYVRLDRPHTTIRHAWSIWVSYSKDLIYWGNSKVAIRPLDYHWDSMKIGPGAPPIKTSKGWLNIYHGVYKTMSGSVYRLGVALHDLRDPSNVIGVSDSWILEPEELCERVGYVPNVVFTCGAVPEDDGTLKLYWGGADTVMCVGEASIDELVDQCIQ